MARRAPFPLSSLPAYLEHSMKLLWVCLPNSVCVCAPPDATRPPDARVSGADKRGRVHGASGAAAGRAWPRGLVRRLWHIRDSGWLWWARVAEMGALAAGRGGAGPALIWPGDKL
jgi:hypothetical protein